MSLLARAWLLAAVVACGDAAVVEREPEPEVSTTEQGITNNDGDVVVTTSNTQLNTYSALAANVVVGATQLTVTNIAELSSGSFGSLAVGDELMVIQMRGASILTANGATYGQVQQLDGAGNYEFVNVAGISGNTITITSGDCGGLRFPYTTAGRSQVVRVIQPRNLTVNAGASIVPLAWTGTRGGVVALHVGGTATINGLINASTFGFRGGAGVSGNARNDIGLFVSSDGRNGGSKGEGIAGDSTTYDNLTGEFSKGAPANGGGGGNAHTSGGGGGANGNNGQTYSGAGFMNTSALVVGGAAAWPDDPENASGNSSGGGRGGYTQSTANLDATSVGPDNSAWGGDQRRNNGGRGGRPVANDPASRLFMGGGGGAGNADNGGGAPASGGNGGGIVVLVANTVTGAGAINANGGAGQAVSGNDGPGGGGAGGTIVIRANTLSSVLASANGGLGGSQTSTGSEAQGPGGGGGGGYIATSGGTITRNVNGALGGTTASSSLTEFPSNGATSGASGELATVTNLSTCFGDVTVAITDSLDPVDSGSQLAYTLTATNNGPSANVAGVTVTHTLPVPDVGFVSATGTGWTCSFTSPDVTCTRATMATGTAPAISVVVDVLVATGTTLSSPVTIATSTAEFNGVNNSDSEDTVVIATNDPPVNTVPGAQTTNEDTTLAIAGVSITDPDAGGANVRVQLTVTNGTLSIGTAGLAFTVGNGSDDPTMTFTGTIAAINTALGSLSFTPTAGFSGNSTFTIVTDDLGNTGSGGARTDTDTVAIGVSAVNDAPVNTVPGAQTTAEDTNRTITGVSIADVDAGAAQVQVTLSVTNGALTIGTTGLTFTAGDGTADPTMTFRGTVAQCNTAMANLTYLPAANFNGGALLAMTTDDLGNTGSGGARTDTDTIAITVTVVNDPPDAVNDARTVAEDSSATTLDLLSNDSIAPDAGETLTITNVTQPANGSAAIVGGGANVTFTPAANFNGSTSFTYTVSDGNGGSDTATVAMTVTPVNDPPNAVDDTRTVDEDASATAMNVLANDAIAPDTGETLTITNVTQPANGTAAIVGGGTNINFQPAASFNGSTSFSYTIADGNGGSDTATVSITVTAVNDPPNAVDDTVTVPEDSLATSVPVLANDSFAPDVGETLTITNVTQPANGTVAITGGGTGLTFQPAASFDGSTSFTYTISDGNGGTDTATVSVTVTGANDPPVAADDTLTIDEDSPPAAIDVLANDTSAPDVGETLTVTAVTQPTGGTAAVGTGGANVVFTPAANANGIATFSYTVSDGNGGTDTATVTVTINAINDDPTARDDAFNLALNAAATAVDVLANDSIAPDAPDTGETLTIVGTTQPANAVVAITGGGTGLTVDPDTGFGGLTTFTYMISDGNGGTATAKVTIGVGPDSDGDNLPDQLETELGTSPTDADSDDDGVKDGTEPAYAADTDGDGLIDALDPDSDDDGLYDGTEMGFGAPGSGTDPSKGHFIADADPSTKTDPLDPDSDDGGIEDGAEDTDRNGRIDAGETDPNDGDDDATVVDTDGDGVPDAQETALSLDPDDADTDDDGVLDGDEPNYADDTDGDTLINANDPDSDNDGLLDGTEAGITTPDIDTDPGAGDFVADADPTTTTSPVDDDTDGGGALDGDEDANQDGNVDQGERDPNNPDDDDAGLTGDEDGDNVLDDEDNCPTLSNPDQADEDEDDVGDACDPDVDGNGLNDDLFASGGGCSSGSGDVGALALVALIGLLVRTGVPSRSRPWARANNLPSKSPWGPSWPPWRRLALVVAALFAAPQLATAQPAPPAEQRDFSVERFQLASDRLGVLGVEWAEGRGHLAFDVALWIGYANDPLVVVNANRERVGSLVGNRTGGSLTASLSPSPWFTIGVDLPLVLAQDRAANPAVSDMLESLTSFGIGDVRLIPKLTILNQKQHGIGLAIVPAVVLPTQSSDDAYFADRGASIAPELDLSRAIRNWRFAGNFGYNARRRTELLDLVVDDEIFMRLGAGYRFPRPKLGIDAAISTAVSAKDPFGKRNQDHLEGLVGGNVLIDGTTILFAAFGAGFNEGFGTPDWRALAGVRIGSRDRAAAAGAETPKQADSDGDGVMDWRDNCIGEPEDKDGFQDSDGCPDPDNDKDTVLDAADQCRDEAGVTQNQGCPAQDTDVDGLSDHEDKCPTEAEDFDQFADDDGCPELDNDGDGLLDPQDVCPSTAGPADNGGCPDTDRDSDGVVDRLDNCPDETGEPNNMGCIKKQLVLITTGKLALREQVQYAGARIKPQSFKLLDNIAAVLQTHQRLVVEVGVHTDNAGNDEANKKLTQQRAEAVVAYLIKKGIDGSRLVAAGFGEEQPEADNATRQGRLQNRRTIFKLIGGTKPKVEP